MYMSTRCPVMVQKPAHFFRPMPPNVLTSAIGSAPGWGRHCWIGRTPGSTTSIMPRIPGHPPLRELLYASRVRRPSQLGQQAASPGWPQDVLVRDQDSGAEGSRH
jgi:hypothetical protein